MIQNIFWSRCLIGLMAVIAPAAASAAVSNANSLVGPLTWEVKTRAGPNSKAEDGILGEWEIQKTIESKRSSYNSVLKKNNLMEASASVRGSGQNKYIGAGATATVADVANRASSTASISLDDQLVWNSGSVENGTVVVVRFDPARLHGQMKAMGSGPEGQYWSGAAHVQYDFSLHSGDRAKQSMTASFSERSRDGGNPEQTFDDLIELNPNGNSELEWEVVIGEETLLSISLWANAAMDTSIAPLNKGYGWQGGSAEAAAWFFNTVYWGGIESVRTLDGRLLTDWTLTSKFGIDWRTGSLETSGVPEPASIALLGLGLAGLGFSRRRRV